MRPSVPLSVRKVVCRTRGQWRMCVQKIKDGTTRCGGTACEPKVCNSYGTCVAGYNRCH